MIIAGLILFILLWAFGFAGLLDAISPLKRRLQAQSLEKQPRRPLVQSQIQAR